MIAIFRSIRILKSGHENSARAVQSTVWRLRRNALASGLGGASQAGEGRTLLFLPSLPCAVIHLRSSGASAFLDREQWMTETLAAKSLWRAGRLRRARKAGRGNPWPIKAALLCGGRVVFEQSKMLLPTLRCI